jgi:hypothetical protein
MALVTRASLPLLILAIALLGQASGQNEDLIPIPEQWNDFPAVTHGAPDLSAVDRPVAEMARTPGSAPPSAGAAIPEEAVAPPKPYVEPKPFVAPEPQTEAEPVVEGEADCTEFFQTCCGPLWTVYGDAIFLHRSRPNNAVVFNDGVGAALLNATDLGFGTAAGFRIGVVRHQVLGTAWDLETLYSGIDGWRATTGVLPATGTEIPFATPLGDPLNFSHNWANFRSELHNVEVNGRRPIREWLSFLAGFRYIELNEELSMFQNIFVGADENLTAGSVDTANHLFGFQIGVDGQIWNRGRLELNGVLKAGIYNNTAKNQATWSESLIPGVDIARASDDHTAFVGEIGLTGLYKLDRGWAIRGGYQLLWIEGVALASDQIAVSDPDAGTASVNTGGSPFYHGAFVGLEFTR